MGAFRAVVGFGLTLTPARWKEFRKLETLAVNATAKAETPAFFVFVEVDRHFALYASKSGKSQREQRRPYL